MAPITSFAKVAFTATASSSQSHRNTIPKKCATATSTTSPPGSSATTATADTTTDLNVPYSLSEMCRLFDASPQDSLYLSGSSQEGGRGVRLYRPVKKDEIILSIPLSSCFRDDEPPRWYEGEIGSDGLDASGAGETDITDYERYNPSGWASRLAASLLDMDLDSLDTQFEKSTNIEGNPVMEDILDRQENGSRKSYIENEEECANGAKSNLEKGRKMWQSLLPDPDILRASLPVHWREECLANAKCTALELAVDSAYFARAGAVMKLEEEWKEWSTALSGPGQSVLLEDLQKKCHDALDVVQTRACRVERTCEDGVQWGPPLRILAPIFDFINHGSSRTSSGSSANASFRIEGAKMIDLDDAKLVVRALRDLDEGEEVLIDYGHSARPAWRCLTSYGFVPEYSPNADIVDEEEDELNVENIAELWMNGLRFEVDSNSVPYDLVEVAAAQTLLDGAYDEDGMQGEEADDEVGFENGGLPPQVARTIAKRATNAAYHLLLEPELGSTEDEWDSPDLVHSASLAASLRWSQHKVLLAFAENLRRFSVSSSDGVA